MIATIKSNKEITIKADSRSGATEYGIVEISITEITHRLSDDARIFKIEDFLLVPYTESTDPVTNEIIPAGITRKRLKIGNKNFKTITKTKEEYETLEFYFYSAYPDSTIDEIHTFALLVETQSNPIYGTTANDWEDAI